MGTKDSGTFLMYNGPVIWWEHWEEAFKFNSKFGLRIHRKLTKDHIYITNTSKIRNYLAEDVLFHEMLALMKAYQKTLNAPDDLNATEVFGEYHHVGSHFH